MQNASRFYASLVILLTVSATSCVTLRPMPKLTKGLTNGPKQQVDALNSQGTAFQFKFSDKNSDGTYMFDKWVCAPGEQVIDMASWLQELLVVMGKGAQK